MTELFKALECAESSVEVEYRSLIFDFNDKLFFSDITDKKELLLSFLSDNNFAVAKAIEKSCLKRVYLFEYEKRREILNNKLLFIKNFKKTKNEWPFKILKQ